MTSDIDIKDSPPIDLPERAFDARMNPDPRSV